MKPSFSYGKHVWANFAISAIVFAIVDINKWYAYQYLTVMWVVPAAGLVMQWWVDEFVLESSDTYQEIIVNRNIAYAVWFLCFTTLIVAGIAAAFLLYFSIKVGKS